MNNITIYPVTWASPEYEQVWQLREEVLRRPLGMSLANEDLGMDTEDTILVAVYDQKVIGCVMLHHLDNSMVKLRQMAVYDQWQGHNIGRKLMQAAEELAEEMSYSIITFHARCSAIGFYEKLGYAVKGEEFTEVGIPHKVMEKCID